MKKYKLQGTRYKQEASSFVSLRLVSCDLTDRRKV